MKIFSLFLLLIALSIKSNAQENNSKDYIIISGKIDGVKVGMDGKKSIILYYPYYMNKGMDGINISLKEDGTFIDTFSSGPGVYCLWDSHNAVSIYFNKSNTYSIIYDATEFKNGGKVSLGGDDITTNNYFIEKTQAGEYADREADKRTEIEYRQQLSDIHKKQLSRLENAKIPEDIKADERIEFNYSYLAELLFFTMIKKHSDPTFESSAITNNELDVDYFDESKYRNYDRYYRLADWYYEYEVQKVSDLFKKIDSTYDYRQHYIRLLDSLIPNEYIKNDQIDLYGVSNFKASGDKEAYYKDYQKYYTGDNEKFKMKMDDTYLRFSNLKRGSISPEFNDYRNYAGGSNSLKDFRGKYVYIDVWATWCGNCWNEMPYLKTLEESYNDKNIVFVSLSVDKYEKDWKDAIIKEKMEGIQLLVKGKQDPFIKEYAISSIPRYILIDPEGNIVDYNAPRPSDKAAVDKLFGSVGL